jgi:hypothetical protein
MFCEMIADWPFGQNWKNEFHKWYDRSVSLESTDLNMVQAW